MPREAGTTSEKSIADQLQGKVLTEREHQDPDKHWIGESLPIPTQTEIAATVGSVSGPGDSPFPARADHIHKLGASVIQTANIADDAVTGPKIADNVYPTFCYHGPGAADTAGTGTGFADWFTFPALVGVPTWAVTALVNINIGNCTSITAACLYMFSIGLGTTDEDIDRGVFDTSAAGVNQTISWWSTILTPNFGNQLLTVRSRRVSGTGQARVSTTSKITAAVFFRPF